MSDELGDLVGDSVKIDGGPSSGLHDVYKDLYWDTGRKICSSGGESANARV